MRLEAVGYRLIVELTVEKQSKGGIVFAVDDRDVRKAEEAIVVAMGPQAYKGIGDGVPWCKIGDKVRIRSNFGNLMECDGKWYRTINDDDVLAVVREEADHG